MTARPLHKADVEARQAEQIVRLQRRLEVEHALRVAAERNANRFHALMLQARINLITKKNTAA